MRKLLIPAFAAVLGLASVSVFAMEVQLNDQERAELRQRVEHVRQQGLMGRTVASTETHAVQHRPVTKTTAKTTAKAKKTKHKSKNKAPSAKPQSSKKTT